MERRVWRSKWWLVAGYWVVQAGAVYFLSPLAVISAVNVSPKTGDLGGVTWREYVEAIAEPAWAGWAAALIGILMAAQLILVWPVRKPAPVGSRGMPLMLSLGLAGLCAALLSSGLVLAVVHAAAVYVMEMPSPWIEDGEWVMLGWCLVNWAVATPLLIRYCRRGRREDRLAKVASRLFTGTMIEAAAIIPLDVMLRKRENCHCGSGTFLALLTCAAVGMIALGPAVFLPVVTRRRKRWYADRCDRCGYDMTGTPSAERCPECGLGWRKGEGVEVTR